MILFVMPTCVILVWMSWPFFLDAYASGETSSNAGGLIRWPVKIAMPIGFAMLAAQGVSEIIKRIGYLAGVYNMDTQYERPLQ
jgi:TRAP-type mannitol/chloroaromatic compound transport system permease small subunit